jgi:hypothetical protein
VKLPQPSKLAPEFREDFARFIALNPAVKKWSNCVAFATFDPFACIIRNALRGSAVIPQILKTPEAGIRKNLDIMIWWDDLGTAGGSYHFALIDGPHYLMQTGPGGSLLKAEIDKTHDSITRKFQRCKRVHKFDLPLSARYSRSRKNRELVKRIYRALSDKAFDKLSGVISGWDSIMRKELGEKQEAA